MHEGMVGHMMRRVFRPRSQPKQPHPAIYRVFPTAGRCGVCARLRILTYVDRELGEMVCTNCLSCVEAADRQLSLLYQRPNHLV